MDLNMPLLPTKYYKEAKKKLEIKDLLGFVAKIGIAVELAINSNDLEMIKKSTYLQTEGLFKLKQHKKVVEASDLAIKYNKDNDLYKLINIKGKALGFLGETDQAVHIFKELMKKTEDKADLARMHINISWVYLSLIKDQPKELLDEVKDHLDLANKFFEFLPNSLKSKVLNNYSVYYYYMGDYYKAIKILESAVDYCQEEYLPFIYQNLAEIYLKLEVEGVFEVIDKYMSLSEEIATKYDDNFALGRSYYIQALSKLKAEQSFSAVDILYLSFEHFKKAEAYTYSVGCLHKINEIIKNIVESITNFDTKLMPHNYQELLSKAKSLKTKGLFNINRQRKLFESVSQDCKSNIDIDLSVYEGIIHGYIGNFDKAVGIFKSVVNQTKDKVVIVTSYLNIAWLYMNLGGKTIDGNKLNEAKKYLDLADGYFDYLANNIRYKILLNYSFYYFLKEKYEKAIEIITDAIKYCEEKDLASLYNTLAELYVKFTDDGGFLENVREYLDKAEVLGTKYSKALSLGRTFYLRAEVELCEDQFFTALDTLYISFDYFKQAEATVSAYECLLKINELIDEYNQNNLESLKNNLTKRLANSSFNKNEIKNVFCGIG